MKFRVWTLFAAVSLLALSCSAMESARTPAPTVPAPVMAAVKAPARSGDAAPENTVELDLSADAAEWSTDRQGDAQSAVERDPGGGLLWTVTAAPKSAAILLRAWPALADADGLTIRLGSLDRASFLVLSVAEADGSAYNLVLPVSAGETVEYAVAYEEFGLDENSRDENDRLDADQLTILSLLDITGYLEAPTPNRIRLERIAAWHGILARIGPPCGEGGDAADAEPFRTGIDANYIPLAEKSGRSFRVGEDAVDPLSLFAVTGANAFRTRVWVGEEGESKRDYAAALAYRAQQAGLQPYLVLFLSEDWADVNGQPAPKAWAGLSMADRAAAVRAYAADTVRHFLAQGVRPDFYEIGNEIDYGISGVYADVSQSRDAASLREGVWPDEALLLRAAVEGVRQSDPDARFLLHIAVSWHPDFAAAFFTAMEDFGVDFDYAGLSFYPTAFGSPTVSRFCRTLDRLREEIGKPVIVAETAYPAELPKEGPFRSWRKALAGYPISSEGQAWWLADLYEGMRRRGDVAGVYLFSPDFWFQSEIWAPFALFDRDGRARPGIAALQEPGA